MKYRPDFNQAPQPRFYIEVRRECLRSWAPAAQLPGDLAKKVAKSGRMAANCRGEKGANQPSCLENTVPKIGVAPENRGINERFGTEKVAKIWLRAIFSTPKDLRKSLIYREPAVGLEPTTV